MGGMTIRAAGCLFVMTILIGLPFLPVMGQESLDLDISMEMPEIDTIEGRISVPANLDLLLQGIIKIFADENGDGNISQAEADSFLDLLPSEERDNLSLGLEDLESHIRSSIGIDFSQPAFVDVQDMEFIGLVGSVNSSQPLGFLITFHAEFKVNDSYTHTISIGVDESYSGDVDFEFTIPEDWDFDGISGLRNSDFDGQTVSGTPIGQVDIKISEGLSDEVLYICIAIGVAVLFIIFITVTVILWKKDRKPKPATADQYPIYTPPMAAPASQPIPNTCPTCGGYLSYIPQYQRYYCNNCRQYR